MRCYSAKKRRVARVTYVGSRCYMLGFCVSYGKNISVPVLHVRVLRELWKKYFCGHEYVSGSVFYFLYDIIK
jgi:hypothetical protein